MTLMVEELLPFQQRVVEEKADLDMRLSKLTQFIGTDKYQSLPIIERHLLIAQQSAMKSYSECLELRLLEWLDRKEKE